LINGGGIDGIEEDLREVLGGDYWMLLKYEVKPRTVAFFEKVFPEFFPAIKTLAKQEKEKL
jgi:hypothetical protein